MKTRNRDSIHLYIIKTLLYNLMFRVLHMDGMFNAQLEFLNTTSKAIQMMDGNFINKSEISI